MIYALCAMNRFISYLFFALLPMLLVGCASNIPQSIRTDVGAPLSIAQVQVDPLGSSGKSVRWGGEILSVINHAKSSDVVVLRRALFNSGEPKPEGGEGKRFVARLPGFVDPADFTRGQRLTVVGHLRGVETLLVGEYPYPHPVVDVTESYRWNKYVPPRPAWPGYPFYCDPFWPIGYPHYWWPHCW